MIRNLLVLLLLISALQASFARGEDLVTRDGTVYHDYKVLSHDAGFLTIMYSDGGGKIPLSNLPDDLQKKYGYNKQQADAAVQAAIAQDRRDRQAIAKQEANHQQPLAIQAQTRAPIEATPAVSRPSVPSAYPIPAPALATVNAPSPPTNVQPASAPQTMAPATPEQMNALRKQISSLEDDMVRLQTGEAGLVINSDPYVQTMSADSQKIAMMRGQLDQMEISQTQKTLRWGDVKALHEQIVELEDDIDRCTPDSSSDNVRTKASADYKITDDNEEIALLRQRIALSPKPSITLSPDEAADIGNRIAYLKSEIDQLNAKMSESIGFSDQHQCNSDGEDLALLQEKLSASGNR